MNIGSLQLQTPIALAPMEDVTDLPFRVICKRLGADLVYTEFTASEALIRDIPKALKKITVCDEERPVAIQLFGGKDESLAGAARVAEQFRPDFIDINCGCWVKNHVARNEGAGLLRDLPLFEKIVRSTVKATPLPVTVKTRLGWDHNSIVILDVAKMVEQAGAQVLTLHCRTRAQAHNGFADWEWLAKVKQTVKIPVIGNGDVTTPEDAKAMLETGCDGVMIGRGAIANPWIFREIKHYLTTGEHLPPPTVEERIRVCLEHLKMSVDHELPHNAVIPFRKYYAGYLRGLPNIAAVRSDLMQLKEYNAVVDRLSAYMKETYSTA
ncbi:MAG: tRNA dihydrouridine synthase DusB [Candidatus Omnitrophica bacterium]|nr:tRNA dihydrouridine synthase DusB [Candidatus Omnitrophota bacterium]